MVDSPSTRTHLQKGTPVDIRRARGSAGLAGGFLALVLLGAALSAGGLTIWPLVAATVTALAAWAGQHTRWVVATSFSFAVTLLLIATAVRLYPLLGLGLSAGNTLVLTGLGLVGVVGLVLARGPLHGPSAEGWRTVGLASILPALGGVVALVLSLGSQGRFLSWAMNSDAIWNTVTARNLVNDGGLIPDLHPNSSPLTAALMALSFSPGRESTAAGDLLRHDVTREAEMWVIATLVAAFLAGFVVARSVDRNRLWLRLISTLVAGGVVISWYVAGFSFQYGFYNVMPSIALLFVSWLAWMETPRAPLWGTALQFVLTTVLLASWAPLAIVPLMLGSASIVQFALPSLRSATGAKRGLLAVVIVQMPVYAVFVSLDDLRRDVGSLSGGGAMAPVIPAILFLLVGAVMFAGSIGQAAPQSSHELLGVFTVSLGALVAYGYLGWQVRDAASKWWGYYPAKLVWFMSILLIVVFLAVAIGRISHGSASALRSAAGSLGVIIVVAAVMGSVPPSMQRIGALLPVADIVRGMGASARDAVLPALFTLSTPGEKNVLARYSADPGDDYFVNGWLLQLPATSAQDPIRTHSYYLNATEPSQLCAMIDTWGGGVTVHTHDPVLESELRTSCPTLNYTVVLGDLPRPVS